ncbi:MAG: GNAT family N-acetyltransferase [Clostridia bacterium]|nr:GNAT family N-acetyltransferase [Clostridia bacterium]
MENGNAMLFRKAGTNDTQTVLALYRSVIGTEFCTWDTSYPGETEIAGDLSAGTLYVLEFGREIIGAVSIVPENEMDHLGCWAENTNAREFARVVLRPDHQHKGTSVRLVEGVVSEMKKQGATAIHIAVAKQNIPARKLYRRMGFVVRGEADMYGHRFYLCEMILGPLCPDGDRRRIDLIGIDRVLERGTGKVIGRRAGALLIHDSVSGAYMLGCEDPAQGDDLLRRNIGDDCRLLMVSDHGLGLEAFARYGFAGLLECYQTAYHGSMPTLTGCLDIREAEEEDLPVLIKTYDLVSADEMRRIVERRKLLLGYAGGRLAGFVGEHLEGSMGLMYVFPEFRRQGYASELEKAMISRTLREGFIPFGQVEKSNSASLALQRKLGLTVSDRLICWMWR